MATTATSKRRLTRSAKKPAAAAKKPAAAKKAAPKKASAAKKAAPKKKDTVKQDRALIALERDKASPITLNLDATPILDLATAAPTGDWKHDKGLLDQCVSAFNTFDYVKIFTIGRMASQCFAGDAPLHGVEFMNAFMEEHEMDRSTLTTWMQFFRAYAGQPELVQQLVDKNVPWRWTRKVLTLQTDDGFLKGHKALLKAKSYEDAVQAIDKLRETLDGEKPPTPRSTPSAEDGEGDGGSGGSSGAGGDEDGDALGDDKTSKQKSDGDGHRPEDEESSGAEDALAAYRKMDASFMTIKAGLHQMQSAVLQFENIMTDPEETTEKAYGTAATTLANGLAEKTEDLLSQLADVLSYPQTFLKAVNAESDEDAAAAESALKSLLQRIKTKAK